MPTQIIYGESRINISYSQPTYRLAFFLQHGLLISFQYIKNKFLYFSFKSIDFKELKMLYSKCKGNQTKGAKHYHMKKVKYLYHEPYGGRVAFYNEYIFGRALASIKDMSIDVVKRNQEYIIVTKEGIHTYFPLSGKFVIAQKVETLSKQINNLINDMLVIYN